MKKIAVLKGGWSAERSISLLSGQNVAKSLRSSGYEVYEIDVIKNLKYITDELYKADPDYIYNALHGTGGEDGVIQGILEVFGRPYSHSGVLSSAICFHKDISKKIVKAAGVNVIDSVLITKNELKNLKNSVIDYPFVVKPCENGSSVGVFIIHNYEDFTRLLDKDWTFGEEIIIEKYIHGREFTVFVNKGKVAGSIQISPKNEFFDYESKYDDGGAIHVFDYQMNHIDKENMHAMAEMAYRACKCRGQARIDFLYDEKELFFLEINTQPGVSAISLVTDIARHNGTPFEKLVELEVSL